MEKSTKKKTIVDPVSDLSLSFYCKQDQVYSKKYYLSINSPVPFSIPEQSLYPIDPGVGQLMATIKIDYSPLIPDFPAGPHEILLSFPSYEIPPYDTSLESEDCQRTIRVLREYLTIFEIGLQVNRTPKKKYDEAQHKG